mmetsp:Transcript_22089/g.41151  ORF Transcript_22089/g.41151 Transcript_22089/m.41151 type:complete len:534 (+) Transcript_22089:99-1700(+)|eukprot:CAMPEP_0178763832 /NCGR_PEP_ID=MMETSP0744-20121128/17423_1 /TAXON_ID=913974 /ORGANISM="Nitzschia punctata, Strain CCMP561" /LENGTH=533 /DNA_ID=CAMNT_0020418877 /DNA_START=36 /DNA_END=1637 /DNA_ORIENTATION=-
MKFSKALVLALAVAWLPGDVSGQYTNGGGTAGTGATGAIAIGGNNNAATVGTDALRSIAIGNNAAIDDDVVDAVAVGASTDATADRAVAVGNGAQATATNTVAIGFNAMAAGENNVVIGTRAEATEIRAIAIGIDTDATAASAIALGNTAMATESSATAIGSQSMATATDAAAFGPGAQATGDTSLALGSSALASGDTSIALGSQTEANATNSVAIGNEATTAQPNAMVLGGPAGSATALNVGIGTSTPSMEASLELAGDLGLILNRVNETAQSMIGQEGMILYDTDDARIEFYNGTAWEPVGEQRLTLEDGQLILSEVNQPETPLDQVNISDICALCVERVSIQASAIGGDCKEEKNYYHGHGVDWYDASEIPNHDRALHEINYDFYSGGEKKSKSKGGKKKGGEKKGSGDYHEDDGYYYGGPVAYCKADVHYGKGKGGVVMLSDAKLSSVGAVLDYPLYYGSVFIKVLINHRPTSFTLELSGGGVQSGVGDATDICLSKGDVLSFHVIYKYTDPRNALSLSAELDANGICD